MEEFVTIPENETEPTSGMTKLVSGEQVHFGPGIALQVSAEQDMILSQAGALMAVAKRDMNLTTGAGMVSVSGRDMNLMNGGAQVMIVGGNLNMTNGGAQVMVTGGDMSLTNGGVGLIVTAQTTAQKSYIGVLLSGETQISDDSRVLLNTKQALVFGAAFGAIFALVRWLLPKKKK